MTPLERPKNFFQIKAIMRESEQNQNLGNEVLSEEEKEARGILLAQEIVALQKEGTEEANQAAIAKAQELEKLFTPSAESTREPELYSNTELTLEDGTKVLVKPDNYSFIKDNKTINLFPGSLFNLSGARVRFKGLVDDSDLRAEERGKPVLELEIESGGGLHRIVEGSEIIENGEDFWNWEVLTQEVIQKQLAEWQDVYRALGEVHLPSEEALLAYLSSDPEFVELMQKKEQQGFTQMVIAPLELKKMIDLLNTKVKAQGGQDKVTSSTWDEILAHEDQIQYFGSINASNAPEGGQTIGQIKAKPEVFGILDGCMVSFVKPRQNLLKSSEADEIDPTGRTEIKGGKKAKEYLTQYFSDKDANYSGEQAMIPQEWLGLFAKDLYDKYLKDNNRMAGSVTNLLDTETATWFISTSLPGRDGLPCAVWDSGVRRLGFVGSGPADSLEFLAPRPSVRKKS